MLQFFNKRLRGNDTLELILSGIFCICFVHTGNHVFNPKEVTDSQSKILALLLHKSLVPVEKENPLGE